MQMESRPGGPAAAWAHLLRGDALPHAAAAMNRAARSPAGTRSAIASVLGAPVKDWEGRISWMLGAQRLDEGGSDKRPGRVGRAKPDRQGVGESPC
jgi:hypothetical protein